MSIRSVIKKVPIVGRIAVAIRRRLFPYRPPDSTKYWRRRYASGGASGSGSIGRLALFKADFLNKFVVEQGIQRVAEFGCGDGSQLRLARYPRYIGLDVATEAVSRCRESFRDDPSKLFIACQASELAAKVEPYAPELVLSLDVIYHLLEDETFHGYMQQLFSAASRFVVVYSSNFEGEVLPHSHVRHRCFSTWVDTHAKGWNLERRVDNLYRWDAARPDDTSLADFYVFARAARVANRQ